ncbi:hypothetical protein ACNKHT_15940 [Shigella flexneri]
MTIGNIERYISDQALAKGWRPDLESYHQSGQAGGDYGAGPAGLACADVLTRNGVAVTVSIAIQKWMALLTPAFLLSNWINPCWHAVGKSSARWGIHFELNCEVGKDVSLDSL